MLKLIKFLIAGVIFGIILTKSEVISWYRIQEMFRFQSFHMYGIIGSAVVIGVVIVQIVKRMNLRSIEGKPIEIEPKASGFIRYFVGGSIFGLGWAMTGACPGPLYALFGYGYTVMIVAILSAIVGTAIYGLLRDKLPH